MSRSASLIARSVCAIIRLSMTSASSTRPPVSTTMQGTSVRRAKPYCRSRVSPGRSATNASRVPVMALNKVDLPTFGRPINATTGSIAYGVGGGVAGSVAGVGGGAAGVAGSTGAAVGGTAGSTAAGVAGAAAGVAVATADADGVARYAANLPASVSTTMVSSTATGALLTRSLPTRSLA